MKHTIRMLHSLRIDKEAAIPRVFTAYGEGGSLWIKVFSPEAIEIGYRFGGVDIDPSFQQGHDFLTDQWNVCFDDDSYEFSVLEDNRFFHIELEGKNATPVEICLEKLNGVVSVTRGRMLVHGGAMSNSDAVIPFYPVRCMQEHAEAIPLGRFNFPLHSHDAFYGLGDKSGYPDRRGRRFRMYNRDSLGYDASNSDPLYKAVPFFLKHNKKLGTVCGLFFPSVLIGSVDFGRESPFYYSVEVKGGPFSYIVLLGETYRDIIASYCRLNGFPALPPLFSFGFFGSSMNYVEPDDAETRILRYFDTVERYGIPCEGMYVSSGYLKSSDGKRYAFLWNKQKFPDHGKFLQSLASRGYRLCMNIKPGILSSHPWYSRLAENGYFITDTKGKPYTEFFWGGEAAFIDFSNPEAKAWWKSQLKFQYLDHGCTGIWNDNNELEIEDTGLAAYGDRSLYPVKMAQAAYEACKEKKPTERPWIYSRSGYSGLQRYARTWTGDNVSDWTSLRFNQYMGIGLGLAAMPFFGHDLGGFFGDLPEDELLIRSCQSAVFQPRFVIHSWREDGNPTEPWSYPEALDIIRAMIREHYRFIPYTYTCAFEASMTGTPIDRPLFLEFPDDETIDDRSVMTLYGPYILKVPAVDPGIRETVIRLPRNIYWYDPYEDMLHRGGQELTVELPLNEVRWLVEAGSVIPTSPGLDSLDTGLFPLVEFLLFPGVAGQAVLFVYREDDGCTELSLGQWNEWAVACAYDMSTGSGTAGVSPKNIDDRLRGSDRIFRLTLPPSFSFVRTNGCSVDIAVDELCGGAGIWFAFAGRYRTAAEMIGSEGFVSSE